uniref:Zinc transporter ZIP1 n=1 Tax=Timema bartmani TaxID=61472 RepID=A0A7R9EPT6_9NEOP|nr:unnamed protein product [Timema bartmani]
MEMIGPAATESGSINKRSVCRVLRSAQAEWGAEARHILDQSVKASCHSNRCTLPDFLTVTEDLFNSETGAMATVPLYPLNLTLLYLGRKSFHFKVRPSVRTSESQLKGTKQRGLESKIIKKLSRNNSQTSKMALNWTSNMSEVDRASPTGTEEVVTAKVVSMVCLGCTSLVMGCLPILLARWLGWRNAKGELTLSGRAQKLADMLLSFGGGALLSTTFLHLLPEVEEGVNRLQTNGGLPVTSFPLSQLIICSGFFTIYLIEELLHMYIHHRQLVEEHSYGGEDITTKEHHDEESLEQDRSNLALNKEVLPNYHSTANAGHSHIVVSVEGTDTLLSSIRGFLIVLALSIHELFEGLAVGLERTSGEAWYMLGAVAAHKLVIAFCVSVEMVSTRVSTCLSLIYVCTFSLVTPMGIGAGLLLTESAKDGATNTVLQGLATGTLLFVVFFEILNRQRKSGGHDGRSGIWQLFAVMTGFLVMLALLSAGKLEKEWRARWSLRNLAAVCGYDRISCHDRTVICRSLTHYNQSNKARLVDNALIPETLHCHRYGC